MKDLLPTQIYLNLCAVNEFKTVVTVRGGSQQSRVFGLTSWQ
jgi:hypothetical protein